uniref:Uncharacterized protein n=1 Tax=Lepeophtheirus salmonis TaxID=72036 RepID=A0A0K2V0Q7_LEPSM
MVNRRQQDTIQITSGRTHL